MSAIMRGMFSPSAFRRSAFTLIELLVVIAIIAILSVVVLLVLNPAQILMKSRDANRVADMKTLQTALGLYATDVSGGSLGSANVIYVSIPDPLATSTAGDQCQGLGLNPVSGYTYQCAASSTYHSANGTGWIPINFGSISFKTPLSSLPTDPVNASSSGLYYTYTTNGSQYEVTSVLESSAYSPMDTTDGGTLANVYEVGSKLGLEPLNYGTPYPSLIAYWQLNDGAGTTALDSTGSGFNGGLVGSDTWQSGASCETSGCLNVAGAASGYVTMTVVSTTNNFVPPVTVTEWIKTTASSYCSLFSRETSAGGIDQGFELDIPTNIPYIRWDSSSGTNISSNPGLTNANDGSWHQVAFSISSIGTTYVYVDGVPGTVSTLPGNITHGGGAMGIGGSFWQACPGAYENLRIFNTVLTPAQILTLYATKT